MDRPDVRKRRNLTSKQHPGHVPKSNWNYTRQRTCREKPQHVLENKWIVLKKRSGEIRQYALDFHISSTVSGHLMTRKTAEERWEEEASRSRYLRRVQATLCSDGAETLLVVVSTDRLSVGCILWQWLHCWNGVCNRNMTRDISHKETSTPKPTSLALLSDFGLTAAMGSASTEHTTV